MVSTSYSQNNSCSFLYFTSIRNDTKTGHSQASLGHHSHPRRPGAQRIEAASVDGWTVVVRFDEGDQGLCFEIDSLLPGSGPRWADMAPSREPGADGPAPDMRIKTRRIRGVFSQGLLIPLSEFPEIVAAVQALARGVAPSELDAKLRETSFEELLRVRKFESPDGSESSTDGVTPLPDFPFFIPRTDQERVQNMPDVFYSHRDAVFQESTKMDGSSVTVFYFCRDSPHYNLLDPEILASGPDSLGCVGSTVRKLDLSATLAKIGRNIAIQAELCGSSIQANYEGFPPGTHSLLLYAVWDIDAQRYLPPREVRETWASRLGVPHVPVHGYRPLREMGACVADLVARAEGKGVNGRKREGIVLKQEDAPFGFKAISNSYLVRHG
ncbi:hypothetical protein FZEAL_7015 [Fusarium zealandicum]|uniref:RNA ligase domain-containing protein n=1 Tax=Fusarium zealandicum TaxID=1053134 RepID=A0A8H4UGM1_9HYPO|nr:hypothetical protein FZEAL_7015 [Fusarium zealandicum]